MRRATDSSHAIDGCDIVCTKIPSQPGDLLMVIAVSKYFAECGQSGRNESTETTCARFARGTAGKKSLKLVAGIVN
jgi:hypothetical protein